MEYTFWEKGTSLFGILFILSLLFVAIVTFSILTIFYPSFWLASLFMGLLFAFCFVMLFLDKKYLTKITLTENGIKGTWLNKNIGFIKWEKIIEVKETVRSRAPSWLTLKTQTQQLDIELTKKLYNKIMEICPIPNLKVMINELEDFKFFHRKK